MPVRSLRPCTKCGKASIAGRCEQHQRTDTRPFYHQRQGAHPQWRQLRASVLAEHPYCRCGEIATDVDHIIAKSKGGTDDRSNLLAMCHRCHSQKTATIDGGFGNRRGQ